MFVDRSEVRRSEYAAAACLVLLGTHALAIRYVAHGQSASYLFMLLDNLLAVICAVAAAHRARQVERILWLLLTSSLLLWLAANAFWFLHYLTAPTSPAPPLLAFAYRFYAAPVGLALFLRARDQSRSLQSLLFDLLQIAMVLILMFVGLFYIPTQNMPASTRSFLATHLGNELNLGLCLVVFLRYRFEFHAGMRRIYARILILVCVYTVVSFIGNRMEVHALPDSGSAIDVLWAIPYLLAAFLAFSWKASPADETITRLVHPLWAILIENLTFAALVLAVAMLSDLLGSPWHRWGNVAVGISLLVYALRLTISQNHLQREVHERKLGEDALRITRDQLEGLLADAQSRETELQQLGELVRLVQACLTDEEALRVIAEGVENLLPFSAGAVYAVTTPESVHAVAGWGVAPPIASSFLLEQCWAARSSTVHSNLRAGSALQCAHLHPSTQASVCAPLLAQGELVGLMVLLFDQSPVGADDPAPSSLRRAQILLEAVADHVSPALANLKLRQSLRDQAVRDSLTGLFNRRYMEETLEREVRRSARKHRPLSVLMLDLDHFKRYNDRYGHAAGDTVLRQVGNLLRSRTRTEDVACRYGGEEFVVILVETTPEIALQRAEDIRAGIKQIEILHDGRRLDHITASIGVVSASAEIFESDSLLRAADTALYQSKEKGRDRVTVASPSVPNSASAATTT